MSPNEGLINTGVALVDAVLTIANLPGAGAFQLAVDAALKKRRAMARDILIEAIQREGVENVQFKDEDADEFIQMMLRFQKASEEGAARQNLKLLAQVIVGLKRNSTFQFDKFQTFANVLESSNSGRNPFPWKNVSLLFREFREK